jgi:hypothetical protein
VELNASDTRSKSSLKASVAESLSNTSIKSFYPGMYFELVCFFLSDKKKQVRCSVL